MKPKGGFGFLITSEGSLVKSEAFLAPGVSLSATFSLWCVAAPIPDVSRGRATSMAIADTVWERLARFNVPRRRRRRRRGGLGVRLLDGAAALLRGLGLLCVALIVGFSALARVLIRAVGWLGRSIGRFVWLWLLPALGWLVQRAASFLWWRSFGLMVAFRRVILAGCLVLLGL